MSTNKELVLRAEQAAQKVAQDKTDIQAMVTKLEQVQAPAIASAKENIKQALIEKGQSIDDNVPFSEYGNKVRAIENGGVDTSDATATSNDILNGKTAYGNSGKITGNIPTVTATSSGNVVTVNKGYHAEQKKITVGTAKEATTITPGTTDQTVASGTYLSGKLTVKGDSNLTSGNIKEGISIFGVEGSFAGSGGGGEESTDEIKTFALMHFNYEADLLGELQGTFGYGFQVGPWDGMEENWTPGYADGVFNGKSLYFSPPTEEELEFGEFYKCYIKLPFSSYIFDYDYTIDFWFKLIDDHPIRFEGFCGECLNITKTQITIDDYRESVYTIANANVSLNSDEWYHLAITKKNRHLVAYINGNKIYEDNNFWGLSKDGFGNQCTIGSKDHLVAGYVDELRITRGVLWEGNFTPPAQEDKTHDIKPVVFVDEPLIDSIATYPGSNTPGGGLSLGTRGGYNCVTVVNNDGYISVSDFIAPSSFNASIWIWLDSLNGDKIMEVCGYRVTINGGKLCLWQQSAGDKQQDKTVVSANKWHHILLQSKSNPRITQLYVDGELIQELNNWGYRKLHYEIFGGMSGGARKFKICSGFLTPNEIKNIYNEGL